MKPLLHAVRGYREYQRGLHPDSYVSVGPEWLTQGVGTFPVGSLIVVGGHTNSGKSFFGLELLSGASSDGVFVSLEDSEIELGRRGSSLSDEAQTKMYVACPHRPTLSAVEDILRKASEKGCKLAFVDYVQIMQYDGDGQAWSRTDEINRLIVALKGLSRELKMVVALASQLRRPLTADAKPTLWDLRDSSNLENSAECVILLHRPDVKDPGRVEAFVAKSKSSRVGASQTYRRDERTGILVPDRIPDPSPEDLFQ